MEGIQERKKAQGKQQEMVSAMRKMVDREVK